MKRMSDRSLTEEEYEDYLNEIGNDGYEDGLNDPDSPECPYDDDTREYEAYMDGFDTGADEFEVLQETEE